jgi:hypothetical protein
MRRLSSPCFILRTVAAAACSLTSVRAFTAGKGILLSSRHQQYQHTTTGTASPPSALSVVSSQEVDATTAASSPAAASVGTAASAEQVQDLLPLTMDLISKLRFRELHRELNSRQLATTGTTSQLRDRLRQEALVDECIVSEDGSTEDDCEPVVSVKTIAVVDPS